MLEVREKLTTPRATYTGAISARLVLPFEVRRKSRARVVLDSGEALALKLPRGDVLRDGALIVVEDGRVIEVVAAPERVLDITCDSPMALARTAYHLGNRHVPIEVGDGWLRIGLDSVLARMLEQLGANTIETDAPFEPEAGAYGGGHHHEGESSAGARIHEFTTSAKSEVLEVPEKRSPGTEENLRFPSVTSPSLWFASLP